MNDLRLTPRIYCASPLKYADKWREWKKELEPAIHVVSTWHDNDITPTAEQDVTIARSAWGMNRAQIVYGADFLLAFADDGDEPNGTLVEIGMAFAQTTPVHLVGTFKWGSWRHHRLCRSHSSFHDALLSISNSVIPDHSGVPVNDQT